MMLMIFFGMRVAFASALAGTVGLVWILSSKLGLEKALHAGLGMAGTIPHSKAVTYALSILPMFILIGFLAFHAGLTKSLFEAAKRPRSHCVKVSSVNNSSDTTSINSVSACSTITKTHYCIVCVSCTFVYRITSFYCTIDA